MPGFPSFDRSVIADAFAWTSSRSAPPKPPPPPNPPPPPWVLPAPPPPNAPPEVSCACGASVIVRSVPMLESGSSAVFWAWSRPRVSDEITITSATPIERPATVRIVRPFRRMSSLRRYER